MQVVIATWKDKLYPIYHLGAKKQIRTMVSERRKKKWEFFIYYFIYFMSGIEN